jgi:hypothetical protein
VRRVPLAFVAVAFLAGCGGAGAKIAVRALPRLVLQPTDVPRSAPVELGAIGIADVTPGAREDLHRFGRKGGWIARYRGPVRIASTADLFGSEDGAKKDFDAYNVQFQEEIVDSDASERFVAVPRVGAGSLAVTIASNGVRTSTIAWRDANVTASVELAGPLELVNEKRLLVLARRQERRIAAATARPKR